MAWIYLILAGVFEMIGVTMINYYHKNKNWKSLTCLLLGFGLSFIFLAIAMKNLPMGTAYAVWTGIGASGGAILGMLWFGESKGLSRIFFIALILASTIGLKLIS
ncbi:DMT family transporter [Hazenella coriacea]|uniref:Paired small multidrug resistance pump n=1 Tax=Hazenella coriacea TaxID=1179467 RepID=A0A4R3L6T7_9BACL|nr:multidrug efflux SMR transporter [Hazenella coriacea]TCS93924.1 paired small multidrug resistance pump [Hazenella coriacea]